MRVAIMQPYFMPYIGYFQLINYVDTFVVYDEIEYTKKGWINRNRILKNNTEELISIPLKKDSDFLWINQRCLSDTWPKDKNKMINMLKESYRKAPYFNQTIELAGKCINESNTNLFDFILMSIKSICDHLSIKTNIIVSSTLDFDNNLKSVNKVLAICKSLNADEYINPIGGTELYDKELFSLHGLKLNFLKANNVVYKQFENEFIPFLSIIDVLMFNSIDEVKEMLQNQYEIL